MHRRNAHPYFFIVILVVILLILTGCQTSSGAEQQQVSTSTVGPTITAAIPTITPIPYAIKVGNNGILLEEYRSELDRLSMAAEKAGMSLTTEEIAQRVQTELVGELLLANAAYDQGFAISDTDLDTRLTNLVAEMGGDEAFNDYLSNNAYSKEMFRTALARHIAVEWQKGKLIESISDKQEQIHARQIRATERSTAEQVLRLLQSGSDFETLAFQYDPLTGGELGWFPRGYLTQPVMDDVVFSLQPGEYSQIIETDIGYHIVYVIEKQLDRPLSPDARDVILQAAISNWVNERLKEAVVEFQID